MEIGAAGVEEGRGVVYFEGKLVIGYAACLWSRVASRILLPIHRFDAPNENALYSGALEVDWTEHLAPGKTFAIDCVAADRRLNTRYLALKTKDALVDQLRDVWGDRPNVDAKSPDLRIHVHLADGRAEISIDLSGDALHRRGYRPPRAPAPLKENLAAAILLLAGWPARAARGESFVDPMCGSGTLLVEALWMASDVAPGILRTRWGFEGWKGHAPSLWLPLVDEAHGRRDRGRGELPAFVGFDVAAPSLRLAEESLRRAGFEGAVTLERRDVVDALPPTGSKAGLLVVNPPYGDRLGEAGELFLLYQALGDTLKRGFPGYTAHVLAGNAILAKSIGLRPSKKVPLYNGPIECRLLEIPISETPVAGGEGPGWRKPSAEAAMFENRLRKNVKHLGKWAEKGGLEAYRLYDGDIPEYKVAIDVYGGAVRVQEYARPRSVPQEKSEKRLRDVMMLVPEVLGVSPDDISLRVRRRQTEGAQYEKVGEEGASREVREGEKRFLINLDDYLDTGLFMDHREVRKEIERRVAGKTFLNLFAYTCAATVYAAAGGATRTLSVDLSRTYLDWGRRNLEINGLGRSEHRFVQDDCLAWLDERRDRFDLIFLNPPSYSRSKRMREELDVARDHARLIRRTVEHLNPGGVLLFTTHARGFELDHARLGGLSITDISARMIPKDFERSPFFAFEIRR